jgi:SnoaL-like domain
MIDIPMEDRLAIMELASFYALCCDTRLFDRLASLFVEDCIYDESCVGLERAVGKAALLRTFERIDAELGPAMHTSSNHIISYYDGTIARGLCYVLAEGQLSEALGGAYLRTAGYYDDVYVREHGQWLFEERTLHCLIPPKGATLAGTITYGPQVKHLDARSRLP